MSIKFFSFVFLVLVSSCGEGNIQEKDVQKESLVKATTPLPSSNSDTTTKIDGVLILHSDTADINKTCFILLNQDKRLFTKVISVNGNEPSSEKLKNKILAYYPDYYIIHFNAGILSDTFYTVKVGSEVKLIKKDKYMEFLNWEDYILRFFCTTNKGNPLRTKASETGEIISNVDYKE